MPRGGRRPGAGAPKGNFNAIKSGTSSRRMRLALTTLLVIPEYRHLIKFLLSNGEQARQDVTDLLLASARLLYDRPVEEEMRRIVEQAAARFVDQVGPVDARKAVRAYHRALAVDAAGALSIGRDRPRTDADPAFREFVRLLLGLEFDDGNQRRRAPRASSARAPASDASKGDEKMRSIIQQSKTFRDASLD